MIQQGIEQYLLIHTKQIIVIAMKIVTKIIQRKISFLIKLMQTKPQVHPKTEESPPRFANLSLNYNRFLL